MPISAASSHARERDPQATPERAPFRGPAPGTARTCSRVQPSGPRTPSTSTSDQRIDHQPDEQQRAAAPPAARSAAGAAHRAVRGEEVDPAAGPPARQDARPARPRGTARRRRDHLERRAAVGHGPRSSADGPDEAPRRDRRRQCARGRSAEPERLGPHQQHAPARRGTIGCPAGRSISHSTPSTATRIPPRRRPEHGRPAATLERPTKPPTNEVGRRGVQLVRRAHLLQPPAPQHRDAVAELEGLVLLVGHEHRRDADAADQLADLAAGALAQRRDRDSRAARRAAAPAAPGPAPARAPPAAAGPPES